MTYSPFSSTAIAAASTSSLGDSRRTTTHPPANLAALHAAISAAANSIARTPEPYLISARAPRDASETAAADAAAHAVLVGLYPAEQTSLDADYAAELAKVAYGPA